MRRIASVLRSLLDELRRRKVFRVLVAYTGGALVLLEGAQLTFEPLGMPEWVYTLLVVLAIIGMPLAMLLAWAFDLTPEGIQRTGPATAPTQEGAEPAPGHAPLRSSGRHVALAGALVLLVTSVAGGIVTWQLFSDPPVSDTSIAVFPFAVRGGGSVAYLGEGMVDLLSRNLDAPDLRTISPGMVLSAVGEGSTGIEDVAAGRELAQKLGSRLYVIGSVFESAGQVRIDANVYELGSDEPRVRNERVQGDTADLFALVDQLSAGLLAGLRRGHGARMARTAAVTTGSLPALKEYLAAEQQLRAAHFDSAIAGFERSTTEDTTFALAHYRLAVAAVPGRRFALARRSIDRASAFSDGLADRDRRLIDGFDAFIDGRAAEAETTYRDLLRDYPDDMEASFQLAEVLTWYNPVRGLPVTEARSLYRTVLASDPEFLCPI